MRRSGLVGKVRPPRHRERAPPPLPRGHGDLGQSAQHDGLLQTHERHEGRLQEVHLADQHVGRLRVAGQLLHELVLQLEGAETERRLVSTKETPASPPPPRAEDAGHGTLEKRGD